MLRKSVLALALFGAIAVPALADTISLTGTIRDVKRGDQTGGHPDFETCSTVAGHGTYAVVPGLVSATLGTDGKPVYNPKRPSNDSMSGATNFNQWYNNVAGVNMSMPYTIVLSNGQTKPGGVYTYTNQAFFPIDGLLLGNQGQKDASGNVHNFSFTYEIHTSFTYQPGQTFNFIGDDDVYVFINGTQVIDIGGVHSAANGNVTLFDGKAFLSSAGFTVGGNVLGVTSSYQSQLVQKWTAQGMTGTCPITTGQPYVDLALTWTTLNPQVGTATITNTFTSTSVAVTSTKTIQNVVLKFSDGVEQLINVGAASGTFSGTGVNAGKTLTGVFVLSGGNTSSYGQNYGQWYPAAGGVGTACTLDFFFAERHTTSSTFRIDTSIPMNQITPTALTSLYD